RDAAVTHADVGPGGRRSGAVDDGPAPDHVVEHRQFLGVETSARSYRRQGFLASAEPQMSVLLTPKPQDAVDSASRRRRMSARSSPLAILPPEERGSSSTITSRSGQLPLPRPRAAR